MYLCWLGASSYWYFPPLSAKPKRHILILYTVYTVCTLCYPSVDTIDSFGKKKWLVSHCCFTWRKCFLISDRDFDDLNLVFVSCYVFCVYVHIHRWICAYFSTETDPQHQSSRDIGLRIDSMCILESAVCQWVASAFLIYSPQMKSE